MSHFPRGATFLHTENQSALVAVFVLLIATLLSMLNNKGPAEVRGLGEPTTLTLSAHETRKLRINQQDGHGKSKKDYGAAIASGWGLKGFLSPRVSAVEQQQKDQISVNDNRPVASAIMTVETRFSRVITYEDAPLVHPDDTLDVTESVRRDLHKYAPGKAPRIIVPRGGELSFEYGRKDPIELVLAHILSEGERVTPSAAFRTEESNGIIHVIPRSVKGLTGETIPVRSILETPFQLAAQERTGMQMLEAWRDAVSAGAKKRILIGAAPFAMLINYKDDTGISSQNARDALTEILTRTAKGKKLSWQLLYDPGQQVYAINIHAVQ